MTMPATAAQITDEARQIADCIEASVLTQMTSLDDADHAYCLLTEIAFPGDDLPAPGVIGDRLHDAARSLYDAHIELLRRERYLQAVLIALYARRVYRLSAMAFDERGDFTGRSRAEEMKEGAERMADSAAAAAVLAHA